MMHSETFDGSRSEQPDKELGREQRQTAAKDDAGKLPLRTHLSEHESQPADHDRNQGERPRERTRERSFEVPGGALHGDCANTSRGRTTSTAVTTMSRT